MTKLRFYPDKPWTRDPDDLEIWDKKGCYICQQKVDGWRALTLLDDDGFEIISRHNKPFTWEVESQIRDEIERLYDVFPTKTIIDGEWLSRRSCSKEYNLDPHLYVFDLMRLGGKWLKSMPYEERLEKLRQLLEEFNRFPPPEPMDAFEGGCIGPSLQHIHLPPQATPSNFRSFYEDQKKIVFSEGVVVKHKQSKIVGDRRASKKNPQWYRVKYRAGSDGQMDMSHLRRNKS
jgi:ATP-dependent DNA ligase